MTVQVKAIHKLHHGDGQVTEAGQIATLSQAEWDSIKDLGAAKLVRATKAREPDEKPVKESGRKSAKVDEKAPE